MVFFFIKKSQSVELKYSLVGILKEYFKDLDTYLDLDTYIYILYIYYIIYILYKGKRRVKVESMEY